MKKRAMWLLPGVSAAPWLFSLAADAEPHVGEIVLACVLGIGLAVLPWVARLRRHRWTVAIVAASVPWWVGLVCLVSAVVGAEVAPSRSDGMARFIHTNAALGDGLVHLVIGGMLSQAFFAGLALVSVLGWRRRGPPRWGAGLAALIATVGIAHLAMSCSPALRVLLMAAPVVALGVITFMSWRGASRRRLMLAALLALASAVSATLAVDAYTHMWLLQRLGEGYGVGGGLWLLRDLIVTVDFTATLREYAVWFACLPLLAIAVPLLARRRSFRRLSVAAFGALLLFATVSAHDFGMFLVHRTVSAAVIRPPDTGWARPVVDASMGLVDGAEVTVGRDGVVQRLRDDRYEARVDVESGTRWEHVERGIAMAAYPDSYLNDLQLIVDSSRPLPQEQVERIYPHAGSIYREAVGLVPACWARAPASNPGEWRGHLDAEAHLVVESGDPERDFMGWVMVDPDASVDAVLVWLTTDSGQDVCFFPWSGATSDGGFSEQPTAPTPAPCEVTHERAGSRRRPAYWNRPSAEEAEPDPLSERRLRYSEPVLTTCDGEMLFGEGPPDSYAAPEPRTEQQLMEGGSSEMSFLPGRGLWWSSMIHDAFGSYSRMDHFEQFDDDGRTTMVLIDMTTDGPGFERNVYRYRYDCAR